MVPPLDRNWTLGLAGGWAVLLAVVGYATGGYFLEDKGSATIAVVAPLVGLLVALTLSAFGKLAPLRADGAGWSAIALLAAWAGVTVLSMAWSISPEQSWWQGLTVVGAAAAFAAGVWLGNVMRWPVSAALAALAAAASMLAAWSLVQRSFHVFGQAQLYPRLEQPFGLPTPLAMGLVGGCPAALWLATSSRRLSRAGGAAALGLMLFTASLTGSRGAFAVLVVALALWLWLAPERRLQTAAVAVAAAIVTAPAATWALGLHTFTNTAGGPGVTPPAAGARLVVVGLCVAAASALAGLGVAELLDRIGPRRRALALRVCRFGVIGLIVLAAGGFVVQHGPIGAVDHAWHSVAGGNQVSANPRQHLLSGGSDQRGHWWGEAWRGFRRHPLQGYGGGTFGILDTIWRPAPTAAGTAFAHSAGLEALAGTGLVGAAFALCALVAVALACRRALARLRGDDRIAAAAAAATVAAFALHAQIDLDLEYGVLWLASFTLAGILAGSGLRHEPTRRTRRLSAAAVPVVLAITVGALLPYLGTHLLRDATALADQKQTDESLVQVELSLAIDPVSTDAVLLRAQDQQALGNVPGAKRSMARLVGLEPLSWPGWAELAGFQRYCWHEAAASRRSLARARQLSGGIPAAAFDECA